MARDLTPLSPFNSLFSHSRVLTMEWIQGVKLTTLAPDEINDLVKVGQEAFLIQLLEVRAEEEAWARRWGGFLRQTHTSPHTLCPHLTA
jgi:hypothetical protein